MTKRLCMSRIAPALLSRVSLAAVAMLALAGAPARADEPGALTKFFGLRTDVPPAPDFVVRSRRETNEWIPVHTPRSKPQGAPMPKDELAKQERSLDAARLRQDKLSGRASAPVPDKLIADDFTDPKTKAVANKRKGCGLTCSNESLLPSKPGKEAQ